jgi:hypothetical protein
MKLRFIISISLKFSNLYVMCICTGFSHQYTIGQEKTVLGCTVLRADYILTQVDNVIQANSCRLKSSADAFSVEMNFGPLLLQNLEFSVRQLTIKRNSGP